MVKMEQIKPKRKQGRPKKFSEKLVPVWGFVKREHYSLVKDKINKLIKPYR